MFEFNLVLQIELQAIAPSGAVFSCAAQGIDN